MSVLPSPNGRIRPVWAFVEDDASLAAHVRHAPDATDATPRGSDSRLADAPPPQSQPPGPASTSPRAAPRSTTRSPSATGLHAGRLSFTPALFALLSLFIPVFALLAVDPADRIPGP